MLLPCVILSTLIHLSAAADVDYADIEPEKEYDYVVVGSGSAGAVVAYRLSEDPNVKVLCLEAGDVPPDVSDIPGLAYEVEEEDGYEWNYYTEPMKYACQGLKGQRSFWQRFKGLGGCSSHNYMIYNRGHPKDYERWRDEHGATGWGYRGVLKYFKKAQTMTDPEFRKSGIHGTYGPLKVSVNNDSLEFRDRFLEAAQAVGLDIVDYNAGTQVGFSKVQATVDDKGLRSSTERMYLRKVRDRENLHIRPNAHVLKINIDPQTKTATGVTYELNSSKKNVRATKEVIVSAGAIGSPQLLMLSGIGPRNHLKEMGINCLVDLPVGENLQDHMVGGGLIYKMNRPIGLTKSTLRSPRSFSTLAKRGSGPLSVPAGWEVVGYISTKYEEDKDYPDIQYQVAPRIGLGKLPEYDDEDTFTIAPVLNRPKSIGFLRLRSTNPKATPRIFMEYWKDPDDLQRIIEGMKFAQTMLETKPLKELGWEHIPEASPFCKNMDIKSEEFLNCSAVHMTYTLFHYSGTCKMGNPANATTVVDPELRVKNVNNLRVIDASIMPAIPGCNTNAVSIMIGEKGADLVKQSSRQTKDAEE